MHQDDLAPAWLYRSEAFAEDLEPTSAQGKPAAPRARPFAGISQALSSRLRRRWSGVGASPLHTGSVAPHPAAAGPLPGTV